uniref:Uncharacterized protein n=1 Tax=uncultured marine virus TaxID=186617 RepID=A0A0F7L621_9VIRU|nr:hypothetical protein [uncultured marine virus]
MVFNDTTNLTGIIQECEMLVFGGDYGAISGNTNLLKRFTALSNKGLDRVVSKILSSDTRWQWDDNNQTDYPIATTNLVDGQQDYVLAVSHLKITGAEVMDQNGNYNVLKPIDQYDIQASGVALTEFMKTDGLPQYYDKRADGVFLYPKPDTASVTLTEGLKLYFQRGPSYFESDDTTKAPGFTSIYHHLIAWHASFDYAMANDMIDKAQGIKVMIDEGEAELQDFFNRRDKDDQPKLQARRVNYR